MYFITCMEKMIYFDYMNSNDVVDVYENMFGDIRCWGYRTNKDIAFESVLNNVTDMNEGIYRYAMIEQISEGIDGNIINRWVFEFNRDKDRYFQIETPEWLIHSHISLSLR